MLSGELFGMLDTTLRLRNHDSSWTPCCRSSRRSWRRRRRLAGRARLPGRGKQSVGSARPPRRKKQKLSVALRRGHLRSAESAPACADRDVTQALSALLQGRVRRRLLLRPLHQCVDRHDYKEEDCSGDRDEREDLIDEVAVAKRAVVDREVQGSKVRFAEDHRDERRYEILHERKHDGTERRADDDGDSKIDDVSS